MLAAFAVGLIAHSEETVTKPRKEIRAIATLLMQGSEPSPGTTPLRRPGADLPAEFGQTPMCEVAGPLTWSL